MADMRASPSTGAGPTRPATVITGASSGIGRELALLAGRTDELLLVARSAEALESLRAQIEAAGGKAHVFPCDLAHAGAAGAVLEALAARGLHCRRLVNNAGFGHLGPASKLPIADQIETIDVNLRVLTELSLAVLREQAGRGEGGILNVASIAAFLPGGYFAVYAASKAFVHSLSEALWLEGRALGVTVTSLCPGPVRTGFMARATGREAGFQLRRSPFHVDAGEVARQGWEGFLAGRRTVVPGLMNRVVLLGLKMIPRALVIAVMGRYQASRPNAVS